MDRSAKRSTFALLHLRNACKLFLLLLFCACQPQESLYPGIHISESVSFVADTLLFAGAKAGAEAVITIAGDDLVLDFGGTLLKGDSNEERPDQFAGLAIKVQNGKNITIKNLNVKGYQVALMAEGIDSLTILDCDFSYNARQAMASQSIVEFAEAIHRNDQRWNKYLQAGAGVYLKQCNAAVLQNLIINNGQNGLLIENCSNGLFYNNTIQYNAGIGIGITHSNQNKIMHNRLDWNVLPSNHQAHSGGLLFFEDCQKNIVAYNSVTHSGATSLFVARENAQRVLGGNANNRIEANDFSYTPSFGLVGTSEGENNFHSNTIEGCRSPIIEDVNVANPETQKLPEGNEVALDPEQLQGCKYILFGTYGPYNFSYPELFLRSVDREGKYTFGIFGPSGNWKAMGGQGFQRMSRKQGAIPTTLVLAADASKDQRTLTLEYIGPAFRGQFGGLTERGTPVILHWTDN